MLKTKNYWNLKFGNLIALSLLFVASSATLPPNEFDEYQGYYSFPVKPGHRSYLSGNFCELRGSHFHAGIDIKVGGVVGEPVYATADGYVSRIKISTTGYGNALYIQHPNGTTSVYAHLNEYNTEIAEYVRKAQYEKKTFEIELFPGKAMEVNKGQELGRAGNSGSSGGPHLHFEIRDKNQFPLDPLKFGFTEVVDHTPPVVRKIAFVSLTKDARVNGNFGRFEFDLNARGANYELSEPVTIHGKVGVEVSSFDKADGTRNLNGVSATEMFLDGKSCFSKEMERFSFSTGRDIFVHTNYGIKQKYNRTFFKLYVDNGNRLHFYKTNNDNGKITLNDTENHELLINISDSFGNKTKITGNLKGATAHGYLPSRNLSQSSGDDNYQVLNKTLQLFVPLNKNPEGIAQRKIITFYANRRDYDQAPDYIADDIAVYLWDLRNGIPDSVNVCNGIKKLDLDISAAAGNSYTFYKPSMNIHIPKYALYDTVYLHTGYEHEGDKEIFTVHENIIPLKASISVDLKPLSNYLNKSKTAVYSMAEPGEYGFVGGEWKNNELTFSTREFGKYTILTDSVPPVVKPITLTSKSLRFNISDELSGIKNYSAYVNGEWVLMDYDYKRELLWSEKLDNNKPFTGEVKIRVEDNVGNVEEYITRIAG